MGRVLLSFFMVLIVTSFSGCVGVSPKTFHGLELNPQADASTARLKPNTSVRIILDQRIADNITVTRAQGNVILKVTNFRSAIEDAMKKTLRPNFKDVTSSAAETGKGLELIVLDASVGSMVDTFDFHVALVNNGKDVYEYKDQITPPTRVVGATAFNYQDVIKELTIEYIEFNIKEMGINVSDRLLINNDLSDFWKQF